MNFNKPGWLERYIDFRNELTISEKLRNTFSEIASIPDKEKILYGFIQPTGLMYGYPVLCSEIDYPLATEWSDKDKMKLLLVESLFYCGTLFLGDIKTGEKDQAAYYKKLAKNIGEFFKYLFPGSTKEKTFLGKQKADILITEEIIDNHVNLKKDWKHFFNSFFENSLLFLDIIWFVKWIQAGKQLGDSFIRNERKNSLMQVLKIIAVAADADQQVVNREKKLFDHFLESAGLSNEKQDEANSYLEKGITLDEITFSGSDSWLLRKYFLELTILTVWANKEIKDIELDLVKQLSLKLGLGEEETDSSLIAIESFVLNNWDDVHYLQGDGDYKIISERIKNRYLLLIKKNKRKLMKEVSESKELVHLLSESKTRELTDEEKEKMKTQVFDILKTIPSIAIFLMPLGSVILPLLLKLLPPHLLLPTSFVEE